MRPVEDGVTLINVESHSEAATSALADVAGCQPSQALGPDHSAVRILVLFIAPALTPRVASEVKHHVSPLEAPTGAASRSGAHPTACARHQTLRSLRVPAEHGWSKS